mmetsp:Transcript_111237/g.202289  ORF Transcript_111237/g.202289 Transcript_111237/m.202289 type:complete len:469 (+) Transcript_111237:28-1434(+)
MCQRRHQASRGGAELHASILLCKYGCTAGNPCTEFVDELPSHFLSPEPLASPEPEPSPSLPFASPPTSFSAFWIRGSWMSTPGREPSNSFTKSGSWNQFPSILASSSALFGASVVAAASVISASFFSTGGATSAAAGAGAAAAGAAAVSAGAGAAAGAASAAAAGAASVAAAGASAAAASIGSASCKESSKAARNSSSMSSMSIAPSTSALSAIGNGAAAAGAGAAAAAGAAVPSAGAASGAAAPAAPSAPGAAAAPPSAGAPPSAACCRARSSSIEMRSASASSGSSAGLMPNSKPASPPPAAATPASPSPARIGDDRSTSLSSFGPTGTVKTCDDSLLFTAFKSLSSLGVFSSTSPKLTKSSETLFFFRFLPKVSSSFSVAVTGLPTKATIRCFWFLFCLCLRANCAVWMPRSRSATPFGWIFASSAAILPRSEVGVIITSMRSPAVVSIPTEFSGFCKVLELHTS